MRVELLIAGFACLANIGIVCEAISIVLFDAAHCQWPCWRRCSAAVVQHSRRGYGLHMTKRINRACENYSSVFYINIINSRAVNYGCIIYQSVRIFIPSRLCKRTRCRYWFNCTVLKWASIPLRTSSTIELLRETYCTVHGSVRFCPICWKERYAHAPDGNQNIN